MGTLESNLGRRLQNLRKNAGLTQQKLADKTGLDVKYVAAIENGRKSPSLGVLAKLMSVLKVEPSELFNFTLQQKGQQKSKADEAISTLIRRLSTSKKQLALGILRDIARWNHKD